MENVKKIDNNSNKKEEKNKKSLIIIIIAIIIIIGICVYEVNKIKNNNQKNNVDDFYGLWNIDNITKYEFDGKGRGKMILSESSLEYEFTYKVEDNKILIDFDLEEAKDYTYIYTIDKNILKLKGETPGSGKLQMIREEK